MKAAPTQSITSNCLRACFSLPLYGPCELRKVEGTAKIIAMPIYHFAPLKLGPGSIIKPGNFGRIIRRYTLGDANNGWRMARELIFERVRMASFKDKPSRFDSCFGLPTQEDAHHYRASVDPNGWQVAHEVEIVDTSLAIHTAAFSWIDQPGGPFLEATQQRALQYWLGDPGDKSKGFEVLTESPFRVLACLE